MGKSPYILPERKKKNLPDLNSWGNLKNKYSGKTLFRAKLFEIETGNLSFIDLVKNKWYFEELFRYSQNTRDINMLPAMKKIAGSARFNESTRQRASEMAEILEELIRNKNELPVNLADSTEAEKAEYARRLLYGTRYPQTTEILRLLRDTSVELKRLALFLIGKFKITDMIQEVCACFNIKGLEEDAHAVLMSFGKMRGREIDRCYLAVAGNQPTHKAILRLLAKCTGQNDFSFLVERLWSTSRQARETVLNTLLELKYEPDGDEKEKLKSNIIETYGILSWIISAKICLLNNNNTLLSEQIEKEHFRWKDHLLGLLHLAYGPAIKPGEKKDPGHKGDNDRLIQILAEIIFSDRGNEKTPDSQEISVYQRKFKKLKRFLHGEIPPYNILLEDIVNCDYNILTVWTKACALRSIPEIEGSDMHESVLALLFSPEEILREEAALLISRSGKDLYKAARGRIPVYSRKNIEKIISREVSLRELIFEKVKFLSACFGNIDENELITLAEKTIFVRNDEKGIYSQPNDSILWSFPKDNTTPEVFVKNDEWGDIREMVKDLKADSSYCYMLPLASIREFGFEYPENTFEILRYVDKKEE
ncbi:MAG TPA: hypothetical protein PLX08_12700 [Bacteroidales bacterium]|nr:hypothetical protein [Bacteroidales bacterium]